MKKVCALFLSIFTLPAVASGINANTNSAPCTNNTLETYSGNTNLQADWQPNTINLRWYNGNTQVFPTNTSANTCTYDGSLAIPSTAPSRTGYTFAGWTVRPEINFAATIPTDVNGNERWAIGWYNNANYCYYATNADSPSWNVNCDSDSTYIDELQAHEWKVRFEHGELYGMAGCGTTSGTFAQPGTPTIGSGEYCWCKATGYRANNASVFNGPLSALSWVYVFNYSSVTACAQGCGAGCARRAELSSAFRTALFTPAQ